MTPLITFHQSKNIKDYRSILSGLQDEFGKEHYSYIYTWSGLTENDPEDIGKYWEVWLIKSDEKTIGICGLYSLYHNDNKELWLGWFGILPEHRRQGIGKITLDFMEHTGRQVGCQTLSTYVSSDHAFKFYTSNGFEYITIVAQYLLDHPDLRDYFGEPRDYVISKNILLTK